MNLTKNLLASIALICCGLSAITQSYQNIEAAEWDASQSRWLVGNGSNIIAQDVSENLTEFSSGNASLGMEVMNGYLFASTGGGINAYDLANGEEVMSLNLVGYDFLNGMGSDPATSRLWVSDFDSSIIEVDVSDLSDPTYTVIENNTGSTPNGVVFDEANNRVVFVSWFNNAPIKQIDLTDNSLSTITTTNLGSCDGIDIDGEGNFYVSSWGTGSITKFNNDFSESETLISGLNNPADLSYAAEINSVAVANSGNNTVTVLALDPVSVDDTNAISFNIYPNPSNGEWITIEQDGALEIAQIFDQKGGIVYTLSAEELSNKRFDSQKLAAGIYTLTIREDTATQSQRLVVTR